MMLAVPFLVRKLPDCARCTRGSAWRRYWCRKWARERWLMGACKRVPGSF
jgi:hypothetical protein